VERLKRLLYLGLALFEADHRITQGLRKDPTIIDLIKNL